MKAPRPLTGEAANYVTPPFAQLLAVRQHQSGIPAPPPNLLCFDPGETTGVAYFDEGRLDHCDQLPTPDLDRALGLLTDLFNKANPTVVVMEDYKVYGQRQEQHVGSSLHTPRLIGMLETLCRQRKVPYHKQMAALAKGFVTDKKLKDWGYYDLARRHSRDAIRHGCYFILFPPKGLSSLAIQYPQRTFNRKGGHHVG